ncbi:MAG TPA: excisionase family DNA-binding protein [Micromonosporaceae bacterium]
MTVQEVAERLAVSQWTVYRLIKQREVTSVRIGRARRVVRESVDAYLSRLIEEAA